MFVLILKATHRSKQNCVIYLTEYLPHQISAASQLHRSLTRDVVLRSQLPSTVLVPNSTVKTIRISTQHLHGVKDGEGKPKIQPMESREPNFRQTLEYEYNGDDMCELLEAHDY